MWIEVNQSIAKQANVCTHVDDFYIDIFGHIDGKYYPFFFSLDRPEYVCR
jgi:hypothetical protein